MLAYYHYPFTKNDDYMEYTAEDLSKPENVLKLFDYCQILEAYITYDGWKFLADKYGYEKLYEINNQSGWFDAESIEEFQFLVHEQQEMMKKIENQ